LNFFFIKRDFGFRTPLEKVFPIGKYQFSYEKQTLQIGQNTQTLSTKETEILKMLCENCNQVLNRQNALKKR
jgi:DNA-binding response OmpR family regulator